MPNTYLSSLTNAGSFTLTGLPGGWGRTPAGANRNRAITDREASPSIFFSNDNKEGATS